jgi:hypothetical protein
MTIVEAAVFVAQAVVQAAWSPHSTVHDVDAAVVAADAMTVAVGSWQDQ